MEAVDRDALDTLRESLGDESVIERIINLYLGELEPRMEASRAAIADRDADAAREAAHSLRGSSATLGAARLAELCERLETSARQGDLGPAPGLLEQLEPAARETETVLRGQLPRAP